MSVLGLPTDTQARRRRAAPWAVQFLLTGLLVCSNPAVRLGKARADEVPLKDQPHFRRPVAGAWIDAGKLLAVANRASGSISIVDYRRGTTLNEVRVGRELSDIAYHDKTGTLLTIDFSQHELILIRLKDTAVEVIKRQSVSPYPISIAIGESELFSVASHWSRKLTILRLERSGEKTCHVEQVAEFLLPWNPQNHYRIDNDHIVVHDAYSSRELTLNIPKREWVNEPNMQGTAYDASFGGGYGTLKAIGLYVRTKGGFEVLSTASDCATLGPVPTDTPLVRGQELFYKPLSSDGSSCHSCHIHGHTSYELADTLADGTKGTPKRIPTLLGTRLSDPWAWNGKFRNLDEQVRSSLETTMHVTNYTPEQIGDLTAFLHTLKPPPPLEPATDDPADQAKLARGKQLFSDLGCAKCHVPPLTYTSSDTYDVGLADEAGQTKFNPPSLRGVSQGYSFFHDGRAKTLEEVFTVHGHQLDRALSDQDLADLLRFLRSL